MLKRVFRRAAPPAHARALRMAAPWGLAWMLGASVGLAAEPATPGQAVSVPFEAYQRWRDEPLVDWRTANDRVGEIGGWRTYLREAQPQGDDAAGHDDHGAADTGEPQ